MGRQITTKESTHNDIVHVVLLYLGSKINIDFNPILRVLFFNRVKQGVKPFSTAKIPDNPSEIDLWNSSRQDLGHMR